MKFLKQIFQKKTIEREESKVILAILERVIFKELFDIVNKKDIQNADDNDIDIIKKALQQGKIVYNDGIIKPANKKYNLKVLNAIKSLGGIYRGGGKYKITLPINALEVVLNQQIQLQSKQQDLIKEIDKKINIVKNWKEGDPVPEFIAKEFEKESLNIDSLIQDIETQAKTLPTISPMEVEKWKNGIVADYITSLQRSITGFTQILTEKLRLDVVNAFEDGLRFEALAEKIKKNYDISKNKATFLARNEMGSVVEGYTKARYQSAGVKYYKWISSGDERVRDWHDYLNGKIFSYDEPPVIDLTTKERGNPKSAYNCRCRARAVVLLDGETLIRKTGEHGVVYYELLRR